MSPALGRTPSATTANVQICPLAPHCAVFRSLAFADQVVAAVTTILGGDVRQRLDQIALKPAGHGAGTSWHQDNDYFAEFRGETAVRGLGLWIALHDATVANGTMHVLPGVHHRRLRHVRDPGSDHHVTGMADIDESKAMPIELRAGGPLLFHYGVPHCTRGTPPIGPAPARLCISRIPPSPDRTPRQPSLADHFR